MPLFDYHCDECGYIEEVLVQLNTHPEIYCPECPGIQLVRNISAPNVRIYGVGVYKPSRRDDD